MSWMPLRRRLEHIVYALDEVVGDFPGEAADAEVRVHQAVAGDLLEEILQIFALAERVGEARAEEARRRCRRRR